MKWPYNSPKSKAKDQTVPIAKKDKRLAPDKKGITRGRIGAEVEVIDGTTATPIVSGSYITSGGGSSNPIPPDTPAPVDTTVDLGAVTNLVATWNNSDDSIDFSFDFDLNDPNYPDNKYATGFRVTLDAGSGLTGDSSSGLFLITDPAITHHVYNLKYETHIQILGGFFPPLEQFCVSATDKVNVSIGPKTCVVPTGYQTGLECAEIEVSAAKDGYLVTVLNDDQMLLNKFGTFEVWEVISNATTAPTTGYVRKWQQPVSPALIPALDLADRWVKGRFLNNAGISDCWSTAYKVTPIPGQGVDTLPPNNITVNSVAWSGDNININYTLPATEKPYQLEIVLESSGNSGAPVYRIPTSPTSNSPQDTIIFKSDIAQRFSQPYPSSFTGMIYGIDANGNKNITGVSFNVPAKTNPLSGITPTFTTIATSNGYTVSFNLPSGATRGEIYQKYTSWSGITSAIDYFSGTYQSGGAVGTNTVTITGVKDNLNNTLNSLPTGYLVNATGLSSDTFISAVSGSAGTFTLTFSKYNSSGTLVASNFSVQSSGTITAESLVHSGSSPVTIPSTIYANTYIVIKYYGEFAGYESLISAEQTVVPLNPAIVDNTVPNAPTVASSSVTSSTIALNLSTTDTTTKGYRLRYKKSTETLYTTEIVAPISAFVSGTSTTSWTIKGLTPGAQYNISAAGYNQYNGVGSYSSDINVSASSVTPSSPGTITLSALSYGILASWVAASNTPSTIDKYKVELYNSGNTLIETAYTFSNNFSFNGLKASTTYYVKVYSIDIYGGISSVTTSTNISLNAVGGISDGSSPATSPTPTVNPLYGALEVKWSPASNTDSLTYEVHLGYTAGFTTSASTKCLETSGTFAIVKTLPTTSTPIAQTFDISNVSYTASTATYTAIGHKFVAGQQVIISGLAPSGYNGTFTISSIATNTFTVSNTTNAAVTDSSGFATTYGTTYYVKLIAKDFDGSAAASSGVAGIPLSVDNGDIAANAVRANQIFAGSVSSDKVDANNLLVNKLFSVGGTDTFAIKIDATATPTKLYSGTGTYNNANTAFYLDSSGKLSLKDRLSFDGNNTLTVNGTINALAGDLQGALTINSGTSKIGKDAGGTGNHGLYINANNYWYTTGNFKVGSTNNGIGWDGTSFDVTGSLNAQRGTFTGPILMGSNSYIQLGTSYSISAVSGNGTTITYTTSAPHQLSTGQIVTITGIVPSVYNLTNATIASATSGQTTFTITNTATGTYQYGGTVMPVSGNVARIQISPTAISVYDANNALTTQIVGNATGGANTFTTTKALIGDWSVSSDRIENALITGITKYTGLSASNLKYAFWAGATGSANSDNTAPFSVSPYGAVVAKNITISPSIGSYTGVTASGTGAVMTYTTSSAHNLMIGQSVVVSGMSIIGYNVSGTIQSVPTPTTFTLSGTATGSGTGGTVKVNVISSTNFSVDSTGSMSAQNAIITGNITASTGTFTGNVFMDGTLSGGVAGSLYAATNRTDISGANSTATLSGQGYILNTDGLSFWFGGNRVTYIKNNQSSYVIKNPDGTTVTKTGIQAGTLFTKNAWIGNWEVTETEIRNITADPAAYGSVYLIAGKGSGAAIYAKTGNNEGTAGILGPKDNKTTVAFWAGAVSDPAAITTTENTPTTTPAFYVTYNGDLYARNAKIQGIIKGGTLDVASFSPSLVATGEGYYFHPSGSFLVGSVAGSNIKLISGEVSINVINGGFVVGKNTTKAFVFDPSKDQIRIGVATVNGTNETGLYLKAFPDDTNWSKNDPVPGVSDGYTVTNRDPSTGIPTAFSTTPDPAYQGKIVKGRRFYWGGNKVPPGYNGTVATASTVVGFGEATAGDFFFSTSAG